MMMKCEDVLMSSDLFSNDSLFSDSLNLNDNNPFDFLNTTETEPIVSSLNSAEDHEQTVSEFLENPQSLYLTSNQSQVISNEIDISKKSSTTPEIFENSINDFIKGNSKNEMPNINIVNKDVDMKVTSQQIRNIQPKPNTSSYRIVPVKTVRNTQTSQSQTIKICSSNAVSSVDGIAQSSKEATIKKMVPVRDLGLLSDGNIKKQVIVFYSFL